MVASTFSVFVDTVAPQQPVSSIPSKSVRKAQRVHHLADATTKENVNPLTGELCQPPLKKRKPSTPSVLTCKPIASSSKSTLKPSKPFSGKDRKEKGKKRKLVALEVTNENQDHEFDCAVSSITLLGNRKAYEFTVMPLADVTQAYDESEASRSSHIVAKTLEEEVVAETTESIALAEDGSASKVENEMDALSSKEVTDPQPAHIDALDA